LNNKVKPITVKEGFKVCKVCLKELEVTEFHITKTMKGTPSLMYQCKECESKAKMIRYQNKKYGLTNFKYMGCTLENDSPIEDQIKRVENCIRNTKI
jgi:uncharacterized protein YlaI